MPLVEHNAIEPRQDTHTSRIVLHVQVGQEQVVVHHQYVRIGRFTPGLVVVARVVVRATHSQGLIGIGIDSFPVFILDGEGQVGALPTRGGAGPCSQAANRVGLVTRSRLVRSVTHLAFAQVVAPPHHRGVSNLQARAAEQGQIGLHQLSLQGDRVGAHGHPSVVVDGPQRGWHKVGEALPRARTGFQQPHRALVERIGHFKRHGQLSSPLFVVWNDRRQGFLEELPHKFRVEPLDALDSGFDHPQGPANVVVHDRDADAVITVQPGELHVGRGCLEHARRVVVDHHLARAGGFEQRRHTVAVASAVDLEVGNQLIEAHPADGKDFHAARIANGSTEFVSSFR